MQFRWLHKFYLNTFHTLLLNTACAFLLFQLQSELEVVNNFTRDVSNVIQVKLSSHIDAVVKTLKKTLARQKSEQQTKISELQKEMMGTQIMETVLVAKGVHDCSRNFLDTIEYFLFKFLTNGYN